MTDDLGAYSTMMGHTPDDVPETNVTIIPKSRPMDPSDEHVEALRLNPTYSGDFDTKFGAGSAAKYLAADVSQPVAEPVKPEAYRPAASWSTADILAANKPENPLASEANRFVDGEVRKLQAVRDNAALSSVEAFMRGPAPKSRADWLDDEIRSAERSVGYWQNEISRAGDTGRLSYNADYERAHARLSAAQQAKADLEDKNQRTADPQVQIAIATRISDQKGRVAYAEDQLEAAKDGDLGTGLNVKQYEDNLRHERKKLNALETAMEYARQKAPMDGASATGEAGRAFLRAIVAETPEMLASAVEQVTKSFGSDAGKIAGDLASDVKSFARGLKQDMPAPKQSELLALDPKSPEFANGLKLYAANALGQGIGSTAVFWAAAIAGGPLAAGGVGLSLGVGQMRNALDEEFAREGLRLEDHNVDQIIYTYGAAIGALDSVGALFNLGLLKHEIKTLAVRNMASAIARGAAKGAIAEGMTEGLQEAIQIMGENHALEKGMDWAKFRDRVIEAAAAGAIPGTVFGARGGYQKQGNARARKAYEDVIKQIEAESKLERPAQGTVSTQPETVAEPEQVPRGGRSLPPVQAEARDPATVPKPEPVTPQPETLSELSKTEKTELLDVAKEAVIAKEGEAPEDTLQRMREQRAEGASFGAYDEVFDRLDKIESESEQQRAQDATIQPAEVEQVMDMWRYVEEARKVKEPEGIVDFLRRSGGVIDFGGDVRSSLGKANMRPGLVSNSGMNIDSAARLAWEQGFLSSADRPDINALLEAIGNDLSGSRVVRLTDSTTVEDLRIAREMEEELSQFGVKRGMKENDVRNLLKGISSQGGSGAQNGAANTRGPQPRTISEVLQKDALEAYIQAGGQLDVGSWPVLADALGVDLKYVPAVLEAGVADGLVRKHDGRYWRGDVVFDEDVNLDDLDFAVAGRGARGESEIDKHEQIQALVRLAIGNGQAVAIPNQITNGLVDLMREAAVPVPDGVHVGAVSRIEPINVGEGLYADDDVRVTYKTVSGDVIETTMPLSILLGTRAFFDRSVGGIFSARLFIGVNASKAVAGEVWHESIHARWRHISGALRDRLLAHSEALGVMDMQQGTYLAVLNDPTSAYANSNTLREAYEERYASRADFEDVMQQESVAHLVELVKHGYFSPAEMAPIVDALAELEAGTGFEWGMKAVADGKAAMKAAADRGVTLPDGTQVNGVSLFALRAYHGSPHDFDQFDLSKIGTGEGAQAYGHGLYFAESPSVAGFYKKAVSRQHSAPAFTSTQLRDINQASAWLAGGRKGEIPASVRQYVDDAIADIGAAASDAELAAHLSGSNQAGVLPGHMYEVNIKANPEDFLDWDKPLSQQSEKVRGALGYKNDLGARYEEINARLEKLRDVRGGIMGDEWVSLTDEAAKIRQKMGPIGPHHTGEQFINNMLAEASSFSASKRLREAGIPGIRYLDQGSRTSGDGTYNYVVFDDSLIEIVAKDGQPVRPAILAALSGSDSATGKSMRADLDALGYYSKALEAAKAWPQTKGTPEQALMWLKKSGVKDAEIEATGLGGFLKAKAADRSPPLDPQGRSDEASRVLAETPEYKRAEAAAVKAYEADIRENETIYFSEHVDYDKNGDMLPLDDYHTSLSGSDWADIIPAAANAVEAGARALGFDLYLVQSVTSNSRYGTIKINGESKKVRVADHERQSGLHDGADFNITPDTMTPLDFFEELVKLSQPKKAEPKPVSITREDVIKHLTENRVGLKEAVKVGAREKARLAGKDYDRLTPSQRSLYDTADDTKWSSYSLDPGNPTYRETVLHLPDREGSPYVMKDADGKIVGQFPNRDAAFEAYRKANLGPGSGIEPANQKWPNFQSGHFSEPNIIGHMMTSMTKHQGKPVYTIDQIQSDWGQKLRDGGVRDEAKIAEVTAKLSEALKKPQPWSVMVSGTDGGNKEFPTRADAEAWALGKLPDIPKSGMFGKPTRPAFAATTLVNGQVIDMIRHPLGHEARLMQVDASDVKLLKAELETLGASSPGNPLVNTTDQWTTTTLRRALRQAAEADAEFIAIPSGKTVLSYNPGDEHGMETFYNSIVPKNLRNILQKLDRETPAPQQIAQLETPTKGMAGKGFTLFPLTEKVKRAVVEDGQPLFALSGYRQGRNVTEPESLRFWQKPPRSGDVLMFHGTRKTFDKFDMAYSRDFGVHFGTAEQASERLAVTDMEGARTIPVEITLKNAVVMWDPGFWGPRAIADGLKRVGYSVSQAEFERFQRLAVAIDDAARGNEPRTTRAAILAANQAIAEKLNSVGVDGIWYRNRHEGSGWSVIVWNKNQVRSATSNDVLMAMRPSIANRPLPDSQRRVTSPGTAEPRPLSQLVVDLNEALGLTTRTGRLNPGLKAQASASGGKLRGQYNTATDVTRLAIPLDIETLSHEGGHALEERHGVPLRAIMEANAKELGKLATPGPDQVSEGFAEFFRRYVTNPKMAEARAPNFFKAFEQIMDKAEPALLKRLHEITSGYQDWINAPSGGAVLSTIKSAKKDGLVAELTKSMKKNGFKNVAVDYFHKAYTGVIDGLHPVKMATDKLVQIANQNLAVPLGQRASVGIIAARDPYKLLRLARNAYQGGHVDLMRGVRDYHSHEHKGPSLHDAIGVAMGGFENTHWSDDNVKAFGAYLISRRMVAEWNRFKAGELDGMPDKLSQADHIQAQKDFEQQFPQFIDAADMVYAYQKNLLRKAKDAGFVSEDTYEDLIRRTDYVPAHRDMSDDAEETVSGPGAQVFGANKARLLKQFRGSTRDIINPLETIAKTTYEWNFLIARNDAIRALDRLAIAVGPGGGAIVERIPASQLSGTEVNAIEIVKRAGKQAGMNDADLLFMTSALEDQLGENADTVIFTPGVITEGGEPIIYLWEGGKRVALRLSDGQFGKDMYEAFTGVGRENIGPILEVFAKPTQWLRAGVTIDPAFVAANFLRDNPAAWINSSDHGTYLPRFDRSAKSTMDALRAAFGFPVKDLDVLSSSGGIVGGSGMEGLNASRVDRDIKALQKKGMRVRDVLPHKKQFWELTGVTETGTRLSVFRAARNRALSDGLDEYEATVEAAYTANDLIDFGRHGSRMLAARRLVTFLNAMIQGTEKGLRTGLGGSEVKRAVQDVISPYVRQSDGQVLTVLERKAVPVAAQFYMKMTVIGLIGYALTALYADDPEYEEIPEYFRNTHWLFKDHTGTWRRVPKPFELGAMSLVMERAFEAYYKGDTKAMKRLLSGLGDLVTPPHVVPGVQVGFELWANKSKFSGGPIVPNNLEKLPPELQFTAYTSEFSKWMAVHTGVSAAKIDHAIAGITGSLGRSLLDKSNQIMPPAGIFLQERGLPTLGLPTTPRAEQRDVDRIFVRRFTIDPARSSQSKKEFWKEMSTSSGEMAVKANGYKEFYDRAQFDEASENLKRMKEHERVYALLEGHGSVTDKRSHPMNRARDVLSVTNGIRRDLDTGKLKDDKGNAYSPSDRRVIQEMMEQIQMREARNAQIVLGLPGFTNLRMMPVEPVMKELEAKVPSIAEELGFRLQKAKVKDFDEVRDGYADLKARVLEPDYAEANLPRRKVGRRSP